MPPPSEKTIHLPLFLRPLLSSRPSRQPLLPCSRAAASVSCPPPALPASRPRWRSLLLTHRRRSLPLGPSPHRTSSPARSLLSHRTSSRPCSVCCRPQPRARRSSLPRSRRPSLPRVQPSPLRTGLHSRGAGALEPNGSDSACGPRIGLAEPGSRIWQSRRIAEQGLDVITCLHRYIYKERACILIFHGLY